MKRTIALAAALAGTTAAASPALAVRQSTARTIYATLVGRDRQPVSGLTTTDFIVRDGGRPQQISVRPATLPLRIALIVSDGGQGLFRTAAIRFAEAIIDHGELAIFAMVVDFDRLADYTQNVETLRDALLRLGRTGFVTRPSHPRLVETIVNVARNIRREGYRPAIVVMCMGSGVRPAFGPEVALQAIRESGSPLYVVTGGMLGGLSGVILTEGSKDSGGNIVEVAANTVSPAAVEIASELVNQYEITYTLPQGMAPSDRVSVSSMRAGVTVRAPSRIAR